MDDRLENLRLFCANLQIIIDKGKPVQGGTQYQLIKGNDKVYITLYNNGNCYPRGNRTDLLILAQAWCNRNYTEGTLRPDFLASWREWNINLQIVSDIQNEGILFYNNYKDLLAFFPLIKEYLSYRIEEIDDLELPIKNISVKYSNEIKNNEFTHLVNHFVENYLLIVYIKTAIKNIMEE